MSRAASVASAIPFEKICKAYGLPEPVREYKFHPSRKWRADYCWTAQRVILEVEGGVWKKGGGRHNRGAGFVNDMHKYNSATAMGYRVFRCTPDTLHTGYLLDMIKEALK